MKTKNFDIDWFYKIYRGQYFILSFNLLLYLRKCSHLLYNVLTGIVWCIDHEDLAVADMETEVSEDQVEVKVEEFEGWTKPGISISDITQNILSGLQYEFIFYWSCNMKYQNSISML